MGGLGYRWIMFGYFSLMNETIPSAALDILHHQHAGGRVWPLWHFTHVGTL